MYFSRLPLPQELVNLLLVGRAHSNVFDGTQVVAGGGDGSDDLTLRGIPGRAGVGFLSLFEAFGYIRVGEYFKRPVVPVWVVSSESHYSVLFAAPRGAAWPSDCYERSRATAAKRRLAYVEPADALAVGISALRGIGQTASSASSGLPFDLIYFDGLGRQEALCRLTASAPKRAGAAEDDPPPIEAVVRTLWPGASVAWNGTDPIL